MNGTDRAACPLLLPPTKLQVLTGTTLLQGNPMAFLVENAGGRAITHEGPVLDIVPTSIHERCPIFLGSKANIDRIEAIFNGMA